MKGLGSGILPDSTLRLLPSFQCAQLRERGEITTSRGQLLSWKYLRWVREHPVHRWACPIRILWGSGDNMTPRETVESYARRHSARLTVLEGGEHWFHTPDQLAAADRWQRAALAELG